MLIALLACAPPEHGTPMDGVPDAVVKSGRWTAEVVQRRLTVNGRVLADGALPELAFRGDRLVWPQLVGDGTDLYRVDLPDGTVERITDWPGYEDRPVIAPDGNRVGFFSGKTGVVSFYVLDVLTGEVTHVTNRDLVRVVGRQPDGFIPPPVGAVSWEGDTLSWQTGTAPFVAHLP